VETYLRLMFLKVHYRLGYESLCAEVTRAIACSVGKVLSWRFVG
jgi:hypothetical protein